MEYKAILYKKNTSILTN